jgi:hypothetical protein
MAGDTGDETHTVWGVVYMTSPLRKKLSWTGLKGLEKGLSPHSALLACELAAKRCNPPFALKQRLSRCVDRVVAKNQFMVVWGRRA